MTEILIESEQNELLQHEQTIEQGLKTFVDVGNALLAIRDKRLYRGPWDTFEDYCNDRWGMERRHAYRLMDAAQAVENVSQGTQILPTNERQARPLTELAPELQPVVWQKSVETAPNGKVTAAHVAATAKNFVSPIAPVDDPDAILTKQLDWTPSELERKATVEKGMTVHANMKTDTALIEWAKQNGLFFRVDRSTEWGNPFYLPGDGDRETVVENYGWYLDKKPSLLAKLPSLKGKVLGCWCYPDLCHAGILEGLVNED